MILRSQRANTHLVVNPIPRGTIVLIGNYRLPVRVLNLIKLLTVLYKICHKENSESEQRTMHAIV